jgi:hypothetical protein
VAKDEREVENDARNGCDEQPREEDDGDVRLAGDLN